MCVHACMRVCVCECVRVCVCACVRVCVCAAHLEVLGVREGEVGGVVPGLSQNEKNITACHNVHQSTFSSPFPS